MFNNIKAWARNLKRQIFVLYFAYKDKRVPIHAKIFTACVVAYAFSPIDLIPDFIPIIGYLDDIILVPLGVMFALKMIPKEVITDCEVKAEELMKAGKPKNWLAGLVILLVWIVIAAWAAKVVYQLFSQSN
ncbi:MULTISPECIES: YkvA family protein [Bhargavaea]|uniref:YkvA family protein n=1 Tax=Bhargavaea changchunensis TaxID=2134037 RepID=A0ABW2NLM6_9BACL|nr:YkvA family protein [Bhargavaea sp. CC-171006]